jgi:valyl-tRNA synthetase
LTSLLRLLHPYMPHLTQELWQAIGATDAEPSLGRARFPVADPALIDPAAEAEVAQVFECIRAIRNLRAEVKITPGVAIPAVWVNPTDDASAERLQRHARNHRALWRGVKRCASGNRRNAC